MCYKQEVVSIQESPGPMGELTLITSPPGWVV